MPVVERGLQQQISHGAEPTSAGLERGDGYGDPVTSYNLRHASPAKTRADVVVVGIEQGGTGPVVGSGAADVGTTYGRKFAPMLAALGVSGKLGEIAKVPSAESLGAPLLLLVGLGSAPTPESVRRAAGAASRAIAHAPTVAVALPADSPELLRAVTEGFIGGGYTYTAQRSKPKNDRPGTVNILSPIARRAEGQAAFEEARIVAAAIDATRDWVNDPANELNPPSFAAQVVKASRSAKIKARSFDEKQLAELGCGGILSVGKASATPPRLVELTYSPKNAVAHVAFVGKGITYDSGGLSIKPGASMTTMKCDMAGAAAVVQATIAIARLGLPVAVSTFVPMAENMISGDAMRPGDVVTHYGGTTAEVLNTDAEGRLILADALVRATEVMPDAIINVATLTGMMVTALGERVAGVLGTDSVVGSVLAAGEASGEPLWPMPIPEAIVERVRASKVADLLQHDGVRWGGGLYAAAYLQEFTGGLPWAHLDIAGPAFNGGGPYGHVPTGGTGFAVATLVDYVRGLG